MKILKHYFIFLQFADYIHRPQYYSNFMVHQGSLRATKGTSLGIVMLVTLQHCLTADTAILYTYMLQGVPYYMHTHSLLPVHISIIVTPNPLNACSHAFQWLHCITSVPSLRLWSTLVTWANSLTDMAWLCWLCHHSDFSFREILQQQKKLLRMEPLWQQRYHGELMWLTYYQGQMWGICSTCLTSGCFLH